MAQGVIWEDDPQESGGVTWEDQVVEAQPVVQQVQQTMPPQQQAPSGFQRVGADIDGMLQDRRRKLSGAIERRASGETNPIEAGLQFATQGVVAPALDITGYAVMEGIKMVMPDEWEANISEAAEEVLGSEWAQDIADEWNSLDENTKLNFESAASFASVMIPAIRAKHAAKTTVLGRTVGGGALKAKKKALKTWFQPEQTKNFKTAQIKRKGLDSPYVDSMYETLAETKGIKTGSSVSNINKNLSAIDNGMSNLDAKIIKELGQSDHVFSKGLARNRIKIAMTNFANDNLDIIQPDTPIANAFKINYQKWEKIMNQHPNTPKGLLAARREFIQAGKKSKIKNMDKAATELGVAKEAAHKVILDETRDMISEMVPDTNVKDLLMKQSHLIQAKENLALNAIKKSSLSAKIVSEVQQHPVLALSLVGGGLSGYFNSSMATAAAAAGGFYLLFKTPYGAIGRAATGSGARKAGAGVAIPLLYGDKERAGKTYQGD